MDELKAAGLEWAEIDELGVRLCPSCECVIPKGTIGVSILDQYRNMRSYIDELDPRVVTFAHAAARDAGIELEERPVRGGTDGARLSELAIPNP